jgi:hypothetical protein
MEHQVNIAKTVSSFSLRTKSNFFLLPLISIGLGVYLLDNMDWYLYHKHILKHQDEIRGRHDLGLMIFSAVLFLIGIVTVIAVFVVSQRVSINTLEQTITFKKIFTGKETAIPFTEIEGCFETTKQNNAGKFKVILFVNNGFLLGSISSSQYSNFDELRNSLGKLKYLGFIQYNAFDHIRMHNGYSLQKLKPGKIG